MLSQEQLANFKTRLEQQKRELEERAEKNDNFGLNAGHTHESTGELSSYDNHPADDGTELFERGKDLALNEHLERELEDINKALTALKNGTYGICEVCGNPIDPERLEALPTTTYCLEHSPDKVTSHDRPLEEGVLMPPFGKFDLDEENESVSFDAEDSWQEVQSWGTSETPSDFMGGEDHYNDVYIESGEKTGYVEDYENFIGVDMSGKNITVYPTKLHERYEENLDEEDLMTPFGDLPAFEKEPYTEDAPYDSSSDKKRNGQ